MTRRRERRSGLGPVGVEFKRDSGSAFAAGRWGSWKAPPGRSSVFQKAVEVGVEVPNPPLLVSEHQALEAP